MLGSCLQVERRVVSQLALAHERGLIGKSCKLQIGVKNADTEFSKGEQSKGNEKTVPTIKLQILEKGKKYVDLNLDEIGATFTS